ncbi:MAG: DUF1573 domain-containing protein [Thermoguttaceae bacterium]|jgi:hypothetical protein
MKSGAILLVRFYSQRFLLVLAVLTVMAMGTSIDAQPLLLGGALSMSSPSYPASNGWAVKMFTEAGTEMTRNFGDLALHSEAEQRFRFRNIYKEDVVILSAQSSCSCTSVAVPKKVIKSGETGEIIARVDTSGKVHVGKRKATVTVHFSNPLAAEVQLQVMAHIRADVVFDPGVVEFGSVGQGVPVTKTVFLQYNGPLANWQLIGMKKNSPSIRAEARVVSRNGNRKTYKVDVQLLPTAEPGYINDLLHFTSNETGSPGIFVPVHGQVISALSVKPTYLQFGVIHPGESATRNLVVRGSTPFRIAAISSDDPRMQFKTAKQDSSVHVIPVTLTVSADETPGEFRKSIKVKTTITELPALDIAVFGTISDDTSAVTVPPPQTMNAPAMIYAAVNEYQQAQAGPALGGFDGDLSVATVTPAQTEASEPTETVVKTEPAASPASDQPVSASINRKFGHRYPSAKKIDMPTEEELMADPDAPAIPFTLEGIASDRAVAKANAAGADKLHAAAEQIAIDAPGSDNGAERRKAEISDTDNQKAEETSGSESRVSSQPKSEEPKPVDPKSECDENGWFPAKNASTTQKNGEKAVSLGRAKVAGTEPFPFKRPELK